MAERSLVRGGGASYATKGATNCDWTYITAASPIKLRIDSGPIFMHQCPIRIFG